MRALRFLALACAFSTITADAVRAGQPSAASLPIHATVISVDVKHATVVVQHAALETMPAGKRTCHLRHPADAKRLHPGATIEAYADTRHQTWTLDRIQVHKASSNAEARVSA